jgi:hypothetical protein
MSTVELLRGEDSEGDRGVGREEGVEGAAEPCSRGGVGSGVNVVDERCREEGRLGGVRPGGQLQEENPHVLGTREDCGARGDCDEGGEELTVVEERGEERGAVLDVREEEAEQRI